MGSWYYSNDTGEQDMLLFQWFYSDSNDALWFYLVLVLQWQEQQTDAS